MGARGVSGCDTRVISSLGGESRPALAAAEPTVTPTAAGTAEPGGRCEMAVAL